MRFCNFLKEDHASKLAIRWDAKEAKYTFPDGTSLQPPDSHQGIRSR
jgi:hypothetical protein